MGPRLLAGLLAVCLAAWAETLSIQQLVSFLRSAAKINSDREVAAYLSKVRLSERLDDRTIEVLQGLGAGPRTRQALERLKNESSALPPARPVAAPAPPKPAPPPSPEQQAAIIESVREYALNYSRTLPDFICAQVTRRKVAPSTGRWAAAPGSEPEWHTIDTLTIRLSYFEQKENYKLILRNDAPVTQDYEKIGGPKAFGDFGSLLREVFETSSQASFGWDHWGRLRDRPVMVFSYRVARENSQYRLVVQDQNLSIVAAYRGTVAVDRETHAVMRVTVEAENIPADFPIRSAGTTLDYDYQDLSGRQFLLPLRAKILMGGGDALNRIDEEFRLYRKYSAESEIKFDAEPMPPLPEDKADERAAPAPSRK